jgi:hypothetical protein
VPRLNISPKAVPDFLKTQKHWVVRDIYEYISLPLVICKLHAISTKDPAAWKTYHKANMDIWQLFRKDILNGKIESKQVNLTSPLPLPEGLPGIECEWFVERKSFLAWYKKSMKVLADIFYAATPDVGVELLLQELKGQKNIFEKIEKHITSKRHDHDNAAKEESRKVAGLLFMKAKAENKSMAIAAVIRDSLKDVVLNANGKNYSDGVYREWIRDLANSNKAGRKPKKR